MRQGFLSAQWLSPSWQRQGLLPSCWIRSSEGQVRSGSIAFECVLYPTAGEAHLVTEHLCAACVGICGSQKQFKVASFLCCDHPRHSTRLWWNTGWGWGSGHCEYRKWGGCAAPWDLSCLSGRSLPEPVYSRSTLRCGKELVEPGHSHWETNHHLLLSVLTMASKLHSDHIPATLSCLCIGRWSPFLGPLCSRFST